MINRVVIVGRLTRDPELRRTNSNMAVTTFSIAVDNRMKNADGSKSTSYISCTAWNKLAEIVCEYAKKGSQVGIDGRLQERKYQRKDGTNQSVVEVVCDNVELLGSKGSSNGNATSNTGYTQDSSSNMSMSDEKTDIDSVSAGDLADDDLPF